MLSPVEPLTDVVAVGNLLTPGTEQDTIAQVLATVATETGLVTFGRLLHVRTCLLVLLPVGFLAVVVAVGDLFAPGTQLDSLQDLLLAVFTMSELITRSFPHF